MYIVREREREIERGGEKNGYLRNSIERIIRTSPVCECSIVREDALHRAHRAQHIQPAATAVATADVLSRYLSVVLLLFAALLCEMLVTGVVAIA